MAEPRVVSYFLLRNKLSDEQGYTDVDLSFSFDIPVKAYAVRSMGTSYWTGNYCDWDDKYVSTQAINYTVASASNTSVSEFREFPAEESIISNIHYKELYQEGENQINIYGLSLDGTWSSYEQT